MTVSDGTLQGSATVTVRVHRNVHKPVFSNPNYNVTISEYEGLNDIIHRVIATDNDNSNSSSGVLRYSIVRSVPLSSSPVFIISSTTGEIQLAQSLTNNKTANQYTVSTHRTWACVFSPILSFKRAFIFNWHSFQDLIMGSMNFININGLNI